MESGDMWQMNMSPMLESKMYNMEFTIIVYWGWWRWALLSLDGVSPCQMVGVSASVNLPLHHEVQKFSSGTGSPGWSRKKGCKKVVVVVVVVVNKDK